MFRRHCGFAYNTTTAAVAAAAITRLSSPSAFTAAAIRTTSLRHATGIDPKSNNPLSLPEHLKKYFVQYNELDLPVAGRIDSIRNAGLGDPKHEWVATEKIHGTNYSCIGVTDPQTHETSIYFAKRSGIMDPKEHFFGCHILNDTFVVWMKHAIQLIQQKFGLSQVGRVQLYGELFGAKYKHDQVPASQKVVHVDGRTYKIANVQIQEEDFPQYHPELQWMCFDIRYSESGLENDMVNLSFDDYTDICSRIPGLRYAKPLVRGTLDECLTFDIENFETPQPALLGLGNFPLANNFAEGVVVRHVLHGTPALAGVLCSTVIKCRNSNFMEIKHNEMGQTVSFDYFRGVRTPAIARNGGKVVTPDPRALLAPEEVAVLEQMKLLVSEGRISNTLSKHGPTPLATGQIGKADLTRMLAKDAIKDYLKDCFDNDILNINYSARRIICHYVYVEAERLVDERWEDLMENVRRNLEQ